MKLIIVLSLCLTVGSLVSHFDFRIENLEAFPRVSPKASIDYLVEAKVLNHFQWGCLNNTQEPLHSVNGWNPIQISHAEALRYPSFLKGTTFWINEHMAVGHAMYDVALIQVLQSTKVDRIVLQRAPCMSRDMCIGMGTLESFYKGYYISMIDAFQPGIPIFTRKVAQEKELTPLYVTSKNPSGYLNVPPKKQQPFMPLTNSMCFEDVIRRNVHCNPCFYPGVSADAIQKFKTVAYSMTTPHTAGHVVPPSYFDKDGLIVVSFLYRGLHEGYPITRRMENVQLMQEMLTTHYSNNPKIKLRIINSTNTTRGFQEQMALCATTHVLITEHGAFQSNMMYLRNGSFVVDLRGSYPHDEYSNFERLARMFGVYYAHVVTTGLTSHREETFNITADEVRDVITLVDQYVQEQPYLFNSA